MNDPFDLDGKVIVSQAWFQSVMDNSYVKPDYHGCPFCGSRREFCVKPADETFYARRGCLACNTWFEKPELKNP